MTETKPIEAATLAQLAGKYIRDTTGRKNTTFLERVLEASLTVVFDRRDRFAALVHEQWMLWAKSVIDHMPEQTQAQWKSTMIPWAELPEEARGWARTFADRVIDLLDDLEAI